MHQGDCDCVFAIAIAMRVARPHRPAVVRGLGRRPQPPPFRRGAVRGRTSAGAAAMLRFNNANTTLRANKHEY